MPYNPIDHYNFKKYIVKILRQINHDFKLKIKISKLAANEINYMIHYFLEQVMNYTNRLILVRKGRTISKTTIETSSRMFLPFELYRIVTNKGLTHLEKYQSNLKKTKLLVRVPSQTRTKKPRISKSTIAELLIPVSRIRNIIKLETKNIRIKTSAPIYLAGVVQSMIETILHSCIKFLTLNNKNIISSKILVKSINNDHSLRQVFSNTIMSSYRPATSNS